MDPAGAGNRARMFFLGTCIFSIMSFIYRRQIPEQKGWVYKIRVRKGKHSALMKTLHKWSWRAHLTRDSYGVTRYKPSVINHSSLKGVMLCLSSPESHKLIRKPKLFKDQKLENLGWQWKYSYQVFIIWKWIISIIIWITRIIMWIIRIRFWNFFLLFICSF